MTTAPIIAPNTNSLFPLTLDELQCQGFQLVAGHNSAGVHHLALGDSLAAMNCFQQALSIIREMAETVLPNTGTTGTASNIQLAREPPLPRWQSSLLIVAIPGMEDDASSFYIYDQAVCFLAPPAVVVAVNEWSAYYNRVSMILLLNTALSYHHRSMTMHSSSSCQDVVTVTGKASWLYGMCSNLSESNMATEDRAFAAAVGTASLNNRAHIHIRQNEPQLALDLLQDLCAAFYHMGDLVLGDDDDEEEVLLMDATHRLEIWTNIVTALLGSGHHTTMAARAA